MRDVSIIPQTVCLSYGTHHRKLHNRTYNRPYTCTPRTASVARDHLHISDVLTATDDALQRLNQ
jgi:hypothetical protein